MIGSLLRWFKAPNPTLRPRHDVTDRLRFGRISWHIVLANQLIRVGSLSHVYPILYRCFLKSQVVVSGFLKNQQYHLITKFSMEYVWTHQCPCLS